MEWVIGGFITAIFLECLIRVLSSHERIPDKEPKKTQVTMPLSQWGLLGLLTWGVLHKTKKE